MTDGDEAFYRKRLAALRARLGRDEDRLLADALHPTGGEASGGLSDVPLHPADLGTLDAEEDVTFTLLENEDRLLEEVHRALERLEEGSFGLCEGCRRAIPRERLHTVPYARFCRVCAGKRPHGGP
jgi:RNA polymerase-binding transcription factor DksA